MASQGGDGQCPWCTTRITSNDETVSIGPPPYAAGETHEWSLHEDCAAEWESFAERLSRLSKVGGHRTLIEYPKNHGPDELLETDHQ